MTAGPWDLSDQDTRWPEHPPSLTSVQGQELEYHGKRLVQCKLKTTEGKNLPALLNVDVADVSKVVISVGRLADNNIGSWMPPEGKGRFG